MINKYKWFVYYVESQANIVLKTIDIIFKLTLGSDKRNKSDNRAMTNKEHQGWVSKNK